MRELVQKIADALKDGGAQLVECAEFVYPALPEIFFEMGGFDVCVTVAPL